MAIKRPFPVLLIGLMLIGAAPIAHAQNPPGFEDAIKLLDAWVTTMVAQRGQTSLSIGVVLGDRLVWSKGYGDADIENKVAATPRTLYRVASITKTFTAVAILQLRDAGRLQLDDPIRKHLNWTRIREHDPNAADITIRELLTHTAGLQREVPGTVWTNLTFPPSAALKEEFEQTYSSSTTWKYSNLGFTLLGEVVAAVSGEPWERYVQRHILDPLAMNQTRLMPRAEESGIATGYGRRAAGGPYVKAPIVGDLAPISAAGSIASNIEDLGKYVAFHLGGPAGQNRVLKGASLRDMQRPHWIFDDWQNGWGLGFRVRRIDGRVQVGHPGVLPGFRANLEFIPAQRLGIIALTNSEDGNPASYIDYGFQRLSPIVAKASTAVTSQLPPAASSYVGRYRSQSGLGDMFVTVLDGKLSLIIPDAINPYMMRTILEPTDDQRTFLMRSTGAFATDAFGERLTFDIGADGQILGYRTPYLRYTRVGPLP